MDYVIKKTKNKTPSSYKTIYLKNTTIVRLQKLAAEYKTSFNNVVVSMIEACLNQTDTDSISPD